MLQNCVPLNFSEVDVNVVSVGWIEIEIASGEVASAGCGELEVTLIVGGSVRK